MNQDSTIRSPGADDRQTTASGGLALYELQRPLVEPFLRMFRMANTALDVLFYDVGAFAAAMFARGSIVDTGSDTGMGGNSSADRNPLLTHLDLGALTNPEGSILVVDATLPPYVERFDDMTKFVSYANGPSVGSSARAATAGAPQHQFVHSVQPAGRGTG